MRDFFGAVLERVGVVCFSQLAAENKIMQARREGGWVGRASGGIA